MEAPFCPKHNGGIGPCYCPPTNRVDRRPRVFIYEPLVIGYAVHYQGRRLGIVSRGVDYWWTVGTIIKFTSRYQAAKHLRDNLCTA